MSIDDSDDVRLMLSNQEDFDRVEEVRSGGGGVDATARFFSTGDTEKIIYTPDPEATALRGALGDVATVVGAGQPIDLGVVLDDLGERNVRRLMVEGGGIIHTQFLTAGPVDEIHLVIAPFFVGDRDAPRFAHPGRFPQSSEHPRTLAETRQMGDVALLRYLR
jgi:5-amino-6-(5-phosphoribosylamino)uracil reductase